MKSILAFGDSNTWGLIPSSKPPARYSWEVRWTGILQQKASETRIVEEGLCGRTTVFEDALRPGRKGLALLPYVLQSHNPLDAVILMLGTNDCKTIYGASEYTIGKGIELCLDEITKYVSASRILLVSPLWLGEEVWRPEKDPEFGHRSVEVSRKLKDVYSVIAHQKGTHFLAASDFASANHSDEEHLDEQGHAKLAEAIYRKLLEMNVIV
ncbi:MAG: arylesterase [Clostridiales bacterium]|nr:arylesterase [Clostridiales bacterium]